MRNKIISLALAILMVLALFPSMSTPVSADGQKCGDNATWRISDDGASLIIEGTGAMWSYPEDPPEYAEAASGCTNLIIGEGITSVGSWAFYTNIADFSHITYIQLPSTLKEILTYSFSGTGISSITLPEGLERITGWAFADCANLKTVYFTGDPPEMPNGGGIFENVTATVYYPYNNANWTEDVMLQYGGKITWVENSPYAEGNKCGENATWSLVNGVLTITGTGAIYSPEEKISGYLKSSALIKKVVIGEGITSVGSWAFSGEHGYDASGKPCDFSSLTSVSLPGSLKHIDPWAFSKSGLTEVIIPSTVTQIGGWAFSNCAALKQVAFTGSAPSLLLDCFENVTATVYYPSGDSSWTDDVKKDYGGHLTWVAAKKPTIKTQPKDVTVSAGETATLKVVAAGATGYQWQYIKPDSPNTVRKVTVNGTSAEYKLTAAERHNGYIYFCEVKSPLGVEYTDHVKLTVNPAVKPTITTQPVSVSVAAGKSASFKVAATGTALSYQWYYRTSSTGEWTAVKNGGKAAAYTLTTAARHNGYQYRCKVTSAAGSVYSKTVKLTVITKPTITTQPVSVSVAAGKSASFKVAATGAALGYQWYYRTSSTGEWTDVKNGGKAATYTLTAAARHNGYQYRCKVTNAAGSVYSKTVKLTVITKPTITAQPKDLTVAAGEVAAFKITATGVGLKYQWYYLKPGETTWRVVSVNGTSATYKLTAAARHNGYKYKCIISNDAGSVTSDIVRLSVIK